MVTPQEWLVELEAMVKQQQADIVSELRAEAAQLAQEVARSAPTAGGAVSSAVAVDTPGGARVEVRASNTGERMISNLLERQAADEADAVAAPMRSTDGMVLSQ